MKGAEEGIIYTKKNIISEIAESLEAADQLSSSYCLFLTHEPHTKTHSLSPPHRHRQRHRHHQTHTYAQSQPKRATGAGRKEDEAYCCYTAILRYHYSCAFIIRTLRNKPDRTKPRKKTHLFTTKAADWRPCSQIMCI